MRRTTPARDREQVGRGGHVTHGDAAVTRRERGLRRSALHGPFSVRYPPPHARARVLPPRRGAPPRGAHRPHRDRPRAGVRRLPPRSRALPRPRGDRAAGKPWHLVDRSGRGTRVGGAEVPEAALADGVEIALGAWRALFRASAALAPEETRAPGGTQRAPARARGRPRRGCASAPEAASARSR